MTNDIPRHVNIDHGQLILVTPSIAGDGTVVHMEITAFLRDKTAEHKGSLHRAIRCAFLYPGQALVLAETTGTDKDAYVSTSGNVKFLLIRAETTPMTRPPRHPAAIPAQVEPSYSSVPSQAHFTSP